jgi:Methyltransferase domain
MTPAIMAWGERIITADDVYGAAVLEVGSANVNGSLRAHVESLEPGAYIGVDSFQDPTIGGVDEEVRGENLVARFGLETFDLVLSTEMLEHAEYWKDVVWNMKAVTIPGGLNIVTTRSVGFPYHPFPEDWWRFSVGDCAAIWADWTVEDLTDDPDNPGVFIRARRPADWDPDEGRYFLDLMEVTRQPKTY